MSVQGFSPADYLTAANLPRGPGGPWWMGFFFTPRSALGTDGAEYFLCGHDAEATTPRVYTGGNDALFSYQGSGSASSKNFVSHASRGGQLFETNAPNATDRLTSLVGASNWTSGGVYLWLCGQTRNSSSVLYSWRILVRVDETPSIVVQESWLADDNSASDYDNRNDAVLISEIGRLAAGLSASGQSIENLICVSGSFSWDNTSNRPDNSVVLSLSDGVTTFDDVLNGGSKRWNYILESVSDLSDFTGLQPALTKIEASPGNLVSGAVLTPWLASSTPISWSERIDNGYYQINDFSAKTADVSLTVNLDGSIANLEGRIISGGSSLPGFDWTLKASPLGSSSTSVTFSGIPAGGPYRFEFRDMENAIVSQSGANGFYIGHVLAIGGQSQADRFFSNISSPGTTLTAVAHLLTHQNQSLSSPVLQLVELPDDTGATLMANLWGQASGVPLLVVDLSFPGRSISELFDLSGAVDPTNGSGINIWSGLSVTALEAIEGDIGDFLWLQGSGDITTVNYADLMDLAYAKLDALRVNPSPWLVCPLPRQTSGNPQVLREIQYLKTLEPNFHLFSWNNDLIQEGVDNSHHFDGPEGQYRLAERFSRGLLNRHGYVSYDILGPRPILGRFTSAARDAIDILYTLPNGGALQTPNGTDDLSGWELSADGGAWAELRTVATTEIYNGDVVRFTKLTGDWLAATEIRLRYQFGFPFDTPSPFADEDAARVEIDKFLYDGTGLEGGRGAPAQPIYPSSVNALSVSPEEAGANATGQLDAPKFSATATAIFYNLAEGVLSLARFTAQADAVLYNLGSGELRIPTFTAVGLSGAVQEAVGDLQFPTFMAAALALGANVGSVSAALPTFSTTGTDASFAGAIIVLQASAATVVALRGSL